MVIVGCARVSTQDQDLTLQRGELNAAGCTHIYAKKVSAGRPFLRHEHERTLDTLRTNDNVVVARLDRLARHASNMRKIAERIRAAGAACKRVIPSLDKPAQC